MPNDLIKAATQQPNGDSAKEQILAAINRAKSEVFAEIDVDAITKKFKADIYRNLLSMMARSLGFSIRAYYSGDDAYQDEYVLEDFDDSDLGRQVKNLAQQAAEELLEDIRGEIPQLSEALKKAILDHYNSVYMGTLLDGIDEMAIERAHEEMGVVMEQVIGNTGLPKKRCRD